MSRPRTCRRDYITHLAWEHLQEALESIARERDPLACFPNPTLDMRKITDWWMDGYWKNNIHRNILAICIDNSYIVDPFWKYDHPLMTHLKCVVEYLSAEILSSSCIFAVFGTFLSINLWAVVCSPQPIAALCLCKLCYFLKPPCLHCVYCVDALFMLKSSY